MNVMQLEITKILKNKIYFFISAGLLIVMLIPQLLPGPPAISPIDRFESRLADNERVLENLKDEPEASQVVENIEEANSYLNPLVSNLKAGEPEEALEYEYKYENRVLESLIEGTRVGTPIIEQEKKVAELDYLHTNNYTKVNELDLKSKPSVNYMKDIFLGILPSSLLLMVLSLIISNAVTYDKRNNTINLVNIFPKNLHKIFLNKYFVYLSLALISILIPLGITLIIISFKNGFGNLHYPMAHIIQESQVAIMPMYSFLAKNVIMLILWSIVILSLSSLISLFSGNILIHMSVLIAFILSSQTQLLSNLNLDSILPYLPTSYVDFPNVILGGSLMNTLPSPNINFMNGSITLLLTSLFLMAINLIVLKYRKKL